MRKHIYTGAMGHNWFMIFTGIFLVAYGREIGISYRGFGLLGALSAFAIGFQLLGAHVTACRGRRRGFWFATALASRLCRGVAVAAAFYLSRYDPVVTTVAFVGLFALGSALDSMAVPPWFSWLADLIPADQQGRFWGRRSFWIAMATVAFVLPLAALVDWWSEVGLGLHAFLVAFAAATVIGSIDLFIHRTIPEPAIRPEPARRLGRNILGVLRDRRFRPWLVFKCAWNFSLALGGSMTLIYVTENLGFRYSFLSGALILIVLPSVAGLFTVRYTGALVDRLGTRTVLAWSHVLWSLVPLVWFLATPETAAAWMLGTFLVVGPTTQAAMNAGLKHVTRLPRREDRAMYLAVSMCLTHLAMGTGAFVAGEVLEALEGWSWTAGGGTFVGFHVLFGASFVLRLGSCALTRFLPDHGTEQSFVRAAEGRRASVRAA
jgi:Na+/melibiose symporter-like transporter